MMIFVRDNFRLILWVLGLSLLFAAALISVRQFHAFRAGKAAVLLYEAQKLPKDSKERQTALEKVIESYKNTPSGREAMMLVGNMLFKQGNFEGAFALFNRLADECRGNVMLEIAALHSAAAAKRAMGKPEEAAKTYLTAAENRRNLNMFDSLYQAASCYEELGQFEEAALLYKKIIEGEGGGREIKSLSEERLLWLIANGSISF